MTQLGIIPFTISGDVGGVGLSRLHFQRNDLGTIVSADANAASAAWRALWQAAHSEVPISVIVAPAGECEVIDSATGAAISTVNITSLPAAVNGSSTSHYAAGNGVRINWKTATVHGRRLVRGTTFLVPLTVDAFAADGQVNGTIQSNYVTAASAFLAAMTTASLQAVAWHRPAKGTFVGGVAAPIVSFTVAGMGAMLKSRRS